MSALTSGPDDGAQSELVPAGPPPALRANLWATAAWCALSVLSSVVLFGQRPYLRRTLIDQNNKATKNKIDPAKYLTQVDHDVRSQLVGGLIESLLVSVILLLLAGLAWRGRPWARWVLLALAIIGVPLRVGVVAQFVFGLVPSSFPGAYRAALVLSGLAALAVVILLLHRTTRQYFGALRATQKGNLPAVPGSRVPGSRIGSLGSTGARPAGGGLGALFAPRRRPAPASSPQSTGNDQFANDPGASDPAANSPIADNLGSNNRQGDPSLGATASRRPTATRPGSVKAKGSGNRPSRFKSRQR